MAFLSRLFKALSENTGYTLMRGFGRFGIVRYLVTNCRRLVYKRETERFNSACDGRIVETLFKTIDVRNFVRNLENDGIAFELKLPHEIVGKINSWAESTLCFADREPHLGFMLCDRPKAEVAVGKPILIGQYFNVVKNCPEIASLAEDPVLLSIAAKFLGSYPTFVGANLWWTFPVKASQEDRLKHAHYYHRDLDDFRFFKFFFYLTDVPPGEGAHVCVIASHKLTPHFRFGDRWKLRRYTDQEIESAFPPQEVLEICGSAGTGFAENTLCIHKGSTPKSAPRLLLQLQYALFDYDAMNDLRPEESLHRLI